MKEKDIYKDIMGRAMLDFAQGAPWENIRTWTSVAGEDELPLPYLFRNFEQMPAIEQRALKLCKGSILDIGCGSGIHSLWLQKNNFDVKAIDISKGAIEVCRLNGVKQAEVNDIWELRNERFDTLLLLMNGMGMCGTLSRIEGLLQHLKSLLKPGGQILADSSDIVYMFEGGEEEDDDELDLPEDHYYGEVLFQTFYKELKGEVFPWLYVDYPNLELHASKAGLNCELVLPGDHYDYLARLTIA